MDKLISLLSALLCLLATAVVAWGAFMSFSTGIIFLGIGFTIFALIFKASKILPKRFGCEVAQGQLACHT